MADNDILLKLKLLDEYSAELKKFSSATKAAGGEASKSADKISDSFGGIKSAILEATKVAGFTSFIAGLKNVMDAASAAEQSNAKLGAALKATGQYTDAAVSALDEWSTAMMRAKGVDDELAKSLVADAVAKGKNVEQAKRLTEAAADMAPVVGSVEAAMALLTRASNGSFEALKRYGISVSEAEVKSGNFEAVLKRVEQQFSGQAAAQVETYAGQVKVLAGEFENFKESIGAPLIAAATDWLKMLNQLIATHGELDRAMKASVENASYMKLAQQLSVVGTEQEKLQKLVDGMNVEDSDYATWAEKLADIKVKYNEILAAMDKVTSAAKKQGTSVAEAAGTGGSAAKMTNTKSGTSSSKSGSTSKGTTFYEYSETNVKAVEERLSRLGASAQALAADFDNSALAATMLGKGITDYAQKPLMQTGQKLTDLSLASSLAQLELEGLSLTGSEATETLKDSANDTADALDEIPFMELSDAVADEGREAGKAAKKLAELEAATKVGVAAISSIGDVLVTAIQGGDVGSAVTGALTGIVSSTVGDAIGDALSESLSKSLGESGSKIGSAAGGVAGSVLGAAIGAAITGLMDDEPNTEGGKARKELATILEEWGFDSTGEMSGILKKNRANAAATSEGMGDFWDALAEQLTGYSGGEQGEMLSKAFYGLDLTIGETVDALGAMIASAQGVTDAEGDYAAAQAALLSVSTLTADSLSEVAILFGKSSTFLDEMEESQAAILDAAQAYYDKYGDLGDINSDEFKELQSLRDDYLRLMSEDAETQKENKEALVNQLVETGQMSREDAEKLYTSQLSDSDKLTEIANNTADIVDAVNGIDLGDSTSDGGSSGVEGHHSGQFPAYHSGKSPSLAPGEHFAKVLDTELIAPPEKFQVAADYLASRGVTSGADSTTFNFYGPVYDKREMTRQVKAMLDDAKAHRVSGRSAA